MTARKAAPATPKRVLTRDEILARKVGHGEITIEDFGTVKIRALTMLEAVQVRELEGRVDQVYLIIALGLVEPAMSVADVELWGAQDSAGPLNAIADGIAVVSGMSEGAGKDAYKSTR
ncbi:MAG: hypothetical protein QOG34_2548 [Frankiaceae bacterium]|jgi:hypothetical protein|nr:hypothetical protein [Frankiaceae bacterium]